jgi:hypothetical protein
MFRNDKTIALHAMINHALDVHLQHLPSTTAREHAALRIAWMQDADVLNLLSVSDCQQARDVAQRIRAIRPYTCVGRWTMNDLGVGVTRADVDEWVQRHQRQGVILIHHDDGFWKLGRASDSRDWLDSGRLVTDDTRRALTDHPDHREDFAYLREANKLKYLWIFCSDETDGSRLKQAMYELHPQKGR